MKALVISSICPLHRVPTHEASIEDEVLCGMVVEVLDEAAPGWVHIRTHYRYSGIVECSALRISDEAVAQWETLPKKIILNKNFCDVLALPKVQGALLQSLPRGALLAVLGEAENGWQKVQLADGREGYVPAQVLGEYYPSPFSQDEETIRKTVVERCLLYAGTPYRWGGKSPQGIDCSGLVSMAYLLCGIAIHRDASILEGFPVHEIPKGSQKPGDLLFFPGHVAMYLGNDRYCHSTAKSGSDGFDINSLNPADPDFRADLLENLTQVGSIF